MLKNTAPENQPNEALQNAIEILKQNISLNHTANANKDTNSKTEMLPLFHTQPIDHSILNLPKTQTDSNSISQFSFSSILQNSSSSKLPRVPSKIHYCRVCNKEFRASSLLDIHMRTHVMAKPFRCDRCPHRASQKGNLKMHMKKHHAVELPHRMDTLPDAGIWCLMKPEELEKDDDSSNPRRGVIPESELLDRQVIRVIRRVQNKFGQANLARPSDSLADFMQLAEEYLRRDGVSLLEAMAPPSPPFITASNSKEEEKSTSPVMSRSSSVTNHQPILQLLPNPTSEQIEHEKFLKMLTKHSEEKWRQVKNSPQINGVSELTKLAQKAQKRKLTKENTFPVKIEQSKPAINSDEECKKGVAVCLWQNLEFDF